MRRLNLFPILIAGLTLGGLCVWAENAGSGHVQNLEGRYERTGIVDRAIEAQYKGLGLVLVAPVFIEELLTCPKRGTRADSEFILRKQGAGYIAFLPKAGVSCALAELGSLVETLDGALLLRRSVTLTGEGSNPIHGDQEDRFSKEKLDGTEWLVVATRIEWTKRSLFRSKKMEYRSLVRFRAIGALP